LSLLAKNRFAHFLAYALGALVVWAIAGCGGSGGGMGGGKVSLTIAWPAPGESRYIPPYAHSLSFTLYALDTEQAPISLVVNRPDTQQLIQTVQFDGPIIGGHYTLTGLAKTGSNGKGDTVATATDNVTVQPTGMTTVSLSLASSLYSVELLDMPLSLTLGQSKSLRVKILDKSKTQIFLPNGALSWSIVFGADVVTLDAQGLLSTSNTGSARVRVSEIGAALYSDGTITVTPVAGIVARKASRFANNRGR
jgi:hypothetical protein